jgi:hypothetical protein
VIPLAEAAAALNLTGRQTWRQSMIISIRCDFVSHYNCKKEHLHAWHVCQTKRSKHPQTWLNMAQL